MPDAKPAPAAEGDRVVARPDGYYGVADGDERASGPFPSAAQALRDVGAELGVAERRDRDLVEIDEQTDPSAQV